MNGRTLRLAAGRRLKWLLSMGRRRLFENVWGWSREKYEQYQEEAFRELYRFAIGSVPYYSERRSSYPQSIARLSELRLLPILSKSDVRKHQDALVAAPRPPLTTFHTTSGSTGTKVRLGATPTERALTEGILQNWHDRISSGRAAGRRLVLSGFFEPRGNQIFEDDGPFGTLYVSIYHLNDQNAERIVERVSEFSPDLILGYPSAQAELARLIQSRGGGTSTRAVAVTTSEALLPSWRQLILNHLARAVYDQYGSQEGSHLALECAEGAMHVHPLVGILEILDDQGTPVRVGQAGRVVVTGLIRRSMPLIRYDLGDVAVRGGECSCGLQWPTILAVDGRVEDQIRTRDGGRVGMIAARLFRAVEGISEGQLVQKELTEFEVRIVPSLPGRKLSADEEEALMAILRRRLGPGLSVEFTYHTELPRSANGKFRAVVVEC